MTSNAGYTPEPPISLYGVTKTALVGLGKALAHELGSDGIRVNCIAPGRALFYPISFEEVAKQIFCLNSYTTRDIHLSDLPFIPKAFN